MNQVLARWHEVTFDFQGAQLTLKLRAPLVKDAREIVEKVRAWRRAMVENFGKTKDWVEGKAEQPPLDQFGIFDQVYGEEWPRDIFSRFVKPCGELATDEEPPRAIADGAALYDELGVGERNAILTKLEDLSVLRAREGKASSSPSTSSAATTAPPSDSTATPTAPADGITR